MILALMDEAVKRGARLCKAAHTLGLSVRSVIRWKKKSGGEDQRRGPGKSPENKLTELEKQEVIHIATSPEFRDLPPKQIVPLLADQGIYLASESTFYRILKEQNMLHHRETSKPAERKRPEEYTATGPCQVWSWDITYMKTDIRGQFFYLYMVVDVWSRKIIAARVHENESMDLSSKLVSQSCMLHGIHPKSLVLHADNGGPMKGATMLATLDRLGIIPSFSRPKVSNDNPYSESLFRTMKYRPAYPSKPFSSLEQAQKWVDSFVVWYNTKHLHSSIHFVTPDDRHYGRHKDILQKRHEVYQKARNSHPERWTAHTRDWQPKLEVTLNPGKKQGHLMEKSCPQAA